MAGQEHPTGRQIRLLQPIGRGGFGTVYLAEVRGTQGLVQRLAVKLLHERWAADASIAARARDEARLMSQLNHDNVVRIHGLTLLGDRNAVLMEYVEGVDVGTLATAAEQVGFLPVTVIAQIGEQVAAALHAAWHTSSPSTGAPLRVVHRDIKPPNVLISRGGAVKVMDFGVARAEFEREAHTGSAQFGTGRYMAPERWLYGEAGPESDVFSLGVTLWELATVRPMERLPLDPITHEEAVEERLSQLVGPLGERGATQLGEVLRGLLAHAPEDRPEAGRVVETLAELAEIADGASLRRYARRMVPPLMEARLRRLLEDSGEDTLTGTFFTGRASRPGALFSDTYLMEETGPGPAVAEPLAGPTLGPEPAPVPGGRERAAVLAAALVLLGGAGWWMWPVEEPPEPVAGPAPSTASAPPVEEPQPVAEPVVVAEPTPEPAQPRRRTSPPPVAPPDEPEPVLIEAPPPATPGGGDAITGHDPHVVVIEPASGPPETAAAPPPAPAEVEEVRVKVLADPKAGTLLLGDQRVAVGDFLTATVGVYTARFEGETWRVTCTVELRTGMTKIKFEQKGSRCQAW